MTTESQLISPNYHIETVLVADEVVGNEVMGEIEEEGEALQEDLDKAEEPEVIDVDDGRVECAADQEPEGADARILPDPGEPTDGQREEHRAMGHIPYRSWCKECVQGRSTGEPHRQRTAPRTICVFSFDYLFLDKAGHVLKRERLGNMEDVDVTILVAKESMGKTVFAHVVPQKGVDMEHYAVDLLLRDLKWVGYQKISLKSDNEKAILKLLEHAVTEARLELKNVEQLLEEHPNVYDSSSNGEVEVAVKSLTGVLRTNKLDLEKRVGMAVPQIHPLFSWLVEYCAWMLTVRNKGEDGITAYKRVRGREYMKRLLPFGELVLAHLPSKGPERVQGGALDPRAKEGIFVGFGKTSHSYMVYSEGVIKPYRSVYRIPLSQRWDGAKLEKMDVTVQAMHTGRGARTVPFAPREADEPEAPRGRQARRLELRQADFDPSMGGYGWTEHCQKCTKARLYGWKESINTQHSAQCRSRIEAELATTEKGRERLELVKDRLDRYAAKVGEDVFGRDALAADGVPAEGEMSVPPQLREPHDQEPARAADDLGGEAAAPCPLPEPRGRGVDGGEGQAQDSDAETEHDHSMDDGGEFGAEVPVTPSVGSPMSVESLGPPKDISPVLSLLAADDDLCEALAMIDQDIVKMVCQLGGNGNKYRREREKQIKYMVSEIYSTARVTAALKLMPHLDLVPGFALDLTNHKPNGDHWDFSKRQDREEAYDLVEKQKPYCLVGSPSCSPYCSFQHLNAVRYQWTDEEVKRRRVEANVHLDFVCRLYRLQQDQGRYFLHEHPSTATSWQEESIIGVMELEGVQRVVGDQCQYGQADDMGNPVRKATGWLTNSPCVAKALSKRCRGLKGYCSRRGGGRHATVSGRLAREAAVYPFVLCQAILRGVQKQLQADGFARPGIHGIQAQWEENADVVTYRDFETGTLLSVEEYKHLETAFAMGENHERPCIDAVSGQPLNRGLVELARRKELDYFRDKGVWVKRPRAEAMARTGKRPISIKWIDVNKGDDDNPNYRSRLVAREIRKAGENPIFAPTPPLESLRTILSLAATDLPGSKPRVRDPKSAERTQVSVIDISRAYFCASTDENDPSYVELPWEDPDNRDMCGLLLKHMYGTRKAADGWHCEYAGQLVNALGFEVGDASACVFFHKARDIRCSVHGDDFTTVGEKRHLDWFKAELEKLYELKEAARLGPGLDDDKEVTILNRVIRWTAQGLEYEADPRQQEKLLRDLKLDGQEVKTAATPGLKPNKEQAEADQALPADKLTPYRAVAAGANYLASDRPELQFAAKECCRWMSAPTELGLAGLKRLGRYVAGHPRLIFQYPWQTAERTDTYSDTDWAGCVKTRKSTSGGCLMLGRHLIKTWSSTQGSVSLSSGESEFYGVVKASGVALGYQSLLRDLGHELPVRVWTDSTATIGICGRQGLGKLRHIDTHYLWVQQRVRDRSIELYKVRGEENPADLFTKHLVGRERIQDLLELFGCRYSGGRAAKAPKMRAGEGTRKGELLAVQMENVQELMRWQDKSFPADRSMGEMILPEAYHCEGGLLPHLHGDFELRFPRADAAPELSDRDPPMDDSLEHRGTQAGQDGARFK